MEGCRESSQRSWRQEEDEDWETGTEKTMRQNQKINEALFQWQDLCTVNITLAIRRESNYSVPLLSFLSGREEIWERKSEG